jgi:hypothetical protein
MTDSTKEDEEWPPILDESDYNELKKRFGFDEEWQDDEFIIGEINGVRRDLRLMEEYILKTNEETEE